MRASVEVGAWTVGGALLAAALLAAYVTQPVLVARAEPPDRRADPARLRAHVAKLAGELAPRTAAHPADLDAAAAYIRAQLGGLGLEVVDQAVEFHGDRYRNLVTRVGPDGGERFVVGAHYDAMAPGPGADDDASGVAGLLELAALLRAREPGLRVNLVAFALEEDGLVGSEVHARALLAEGARVRAMFSLEMIGYFRDAPQSQSYPLEVLRLLYPSSGDYIAVVGQVGEAWLARRVKSAMR